MRQVFAGWGVAAKQKGGLSYLKDRSYGIFSAPVAADEYISCVEGKEAYFKLPLLFIYHTEPCFRDCKRARSRRPWCSHVKRSQVRA